MTSPQPDDGFRSAAMRLPLDAQQRACWERRLNGLDVLTHLGAALDLSDPAIVRGRFVKSLPSHAGGLGTRAINGAAIAALVDCGIAATGILLFRGRTCGTLHLSIDFMKPVRFPDPVLDCRIARRTDTLAFVDARLRDDRGQVFVQASGIVALARQGAQDGGSWNELFDAIPPPEDAPPLPAPGPALTETAFEPT